MNRDAHTYPAKVDPGVYLTMPAGHALLSDGHRSLVVSDLGGVVSVAGLRVKDPAHLDDLGVHLQLLAGRLRQREAS
jgi:hypothetical protein